MKKRLASFVIPALLIMGVIISLSIAISAEDRFTPKASMTMGESLVFNIYLPVSEKITDVTLDGENVIISSLQKKDGYYHIPVALDAKDARRDINLTVGFSEEDDLDFRFSAIDYAEKLILGDESATVKALARDMLAYIDSAAVYAGAEPDARIAELLSGYEPEFCPDSAVNAMEGLWAATFVIKSSPSLRLYPQEGYSVSDFSFIDEEGIFTVKEGTDHYGRYIDIKAPVYAISEIFAYTLRGGTSVCRYNLASYCEFAENDYKGENKADILALVRNLYRYSKSASAYRTEVIQASCSHNYTAEVIKGATATEKGIMGYTCPKCSHTYEAEIPTTLKVLAIGNSFSQDAMQHLYLVAKDAGIENVVLGNLYKGGCSLATHRKNMTENLEDYTFYISSPEAGGMITEGTNRTAYHAITYTDWDYITLQQASTTSGLPDKYGDLAAVMDYVNANKTSDAELLWHMTWAYQSNSTHSGFANYGNNQMTMYNGIVSAVNQNIISNDGFSLIIPSGTAVQNLRTSTIGDNLTRDGYHLSYGIGRYTASLTWIAAITGYDIDKITATPSAYPEVAKNLDIIKDAVKNAIANPLSVTESSYPPSDSTADTGFFELSAEDRSYLTSRGFDPDCYRVLEISPIYNAYYNSSSSTNYSSYEVADSGNNQYMKWWTTQVFSKSELKNGTVIRLDSGYKYRPEGWINMQKNSKRPATTTDDAIVVSEEWWSGYNYRAFNVGKSNSSAFTEEEYNAYASGEKSLGLKLYVPLAKRAELTDEDRAYLTSLGLNPEEYKLLDFSFTVNSYYNSDSSNPSKLQTTGSNAVKYVATEILTKYDLTSGSVIRLMDTSSYKYRPEGWITLDTRNSVRPTEVKEEVVTVTGAWWGSYSYRAFNICYINATESDPATAATAEAIRIYVKIV